MLTVVCRVGEKTLVFLTLQRAEAVAVLENEKKDLQYTYNIIHMYFS